MTSFTLTILGSSSALPTSQRFPTAQILNISEQFYLIDCGEGTQMQLRKFRFRIGKINHIFISHIHGDHYFGLFGLISTMQLLDRNTDLHIYGPSGLKQLISSQLDNFNNLSFAVIFHENDCSKQERIFENSKITIETIPLKHRVPTCGFLFREKPGLLRLKKEAIEQYKLSIKEMVLIKNGEDLIREGCNAVPCIDLTYPPDAPRSFAYCSDTIFKEDIVPLIKKIDLLYHEATYAHDMANRAKETFHSTSVQAATIAKLADAKKLIIGHFSARYRSSKGLEDEARTVFSNTFAAEDGRSFNIRD